MLDMLGKLLQQPGVALKMCSLGMVPALEMLRDTDSPEVQCSADRTLTALMQANPTSACQPVSPTQKTHCRPRSRCQSNSPVPCGPVQKQQVSHSLGMFTYSAKPGQTAAYSHSKENCQNISQAFGSQQGSTLVSHRLQSLTRPCQNVTMCCQGLLAELQHPAMMSDLQAGCKHYYYTTLIIIAGAPAKL